jgi:hypothetical protein
MLWHCLILLELSGPLSIFVVHTDRQVEVDSDDEDASEAVRASKMEWHLHSKRMRNKLDMPQGTSPWTSDHSIAGIDRLSMPRHIDAIDVSYWSYLRSHMCLSERTNPPVWFCDASQSVERKAWGDRLGCFARDSVPYSFQLDRILSAEDPSKGNIKY